MVEKNTPEEIGTTADSVLASFSFAGCNRIKKDNGKNKAPSMANVPVLNRIFKEAAAQSPTPSLFFFIGDLVQGKHINKLPNELREWNTLYRASDINRPDIELIAPYPAIMKC